MGFSDGVPDGVPDGVTEGVGVLISLFIAVLSGSSVFFVAGLCFCKK